MRRLSPLGRLAILRGELVALALLVQSLDARHNSSSEQELPKTTYQEFPTMAMMREVGGWGFPKMVLESLNETEELVMVSAEQAAQANAQNAGFTCDEGQVFGTVVVEILEYHDGLAQTVAPEVAYERPLKLRYEIYRLQEEVGAEGDNTIHTTSLEVLTASIDAGEAELVHEGHHFESPPILCFDTESTYALRSYALQLSKDELMSDMVDSFFYVLGPCEVGCFRPHYSANVSGCVLNSLSSIDTQDHFAPFNTTCQRAPDDVIANQAAPFNVSNEQELRDVLDGTRGPVRVELQADIAMVSGKGAFVMNNDYRLGPGLARRVVITSSPTSCGDDGLCKVNGMGMTNMFRVAYDMDLEMIGPNVLALHRIWLVNGSAAYGGAFTVRTSGYVILRDSVVSGCRAGKGGVFVPNPASTDYASLGAVLLVNSKFFDNHALEEYRGTSPARRQLLEHWSPNAGGMGVLWSCVVVARGCEFKGHTAAGNGGVFFVNWRVGLWLYDCSFSSNRQYYTGLGPGWGGVIGGTNVKNGTVYVEGCRFDRNEAHNGGGAVILMDTALAIVNSVFHGNSIRASHGAAVFLDHDVALL
ncbi:hypothetical protein CYMTET_3024, partial [Cymbomonas tetramitiformis]